MAGAFSAHVTRRQSPKLSIDNRCELIECRAIALSPGMKQRSDVIRCLWHAEGYDSSVEREADGRFLSQN